VEVGTTASARTSAIGRSVESTPSGAAGVVAAVADAAVGVAEREGEGEGEENGTAPSTARIVSRA